MTNYPWSYHPVWCKLHNMYCNWHPYVDDFDDYVENIEGEDDAV